MVNSVARLGKQFFFQLVEKITEMYQYCNAPIHQTNKRHTNSVDITKCRKGKHELPTLIQ